MRVEKDFRDFLKLLNENKAKYLIVGGFAYSYYAQPRFTRDIDIFIESSEENAKKILPVISEFWQQETELKIADLLEKDAIIQLGYDPIRIDIVTTISGVEFYEAWEKRVKVKYGDIEVFFISLDDLIKNKISTGRSRDGLDAQDLIKIKEQKPNPYS